MKVNFSINNRNYRTYKILTLEDVLSYFNYQKQIFVVEYNTKIYNKNRYKDINLQNNDNIEILTIVGGG